MPPFAVTADVTDIVTITDATYDLDAGQLTVAATSSDDRPLTVAGFGAPGTFATAAPPAEVTVTSDQAGQRHTDRGGDRCRFPPAPVVARAGADREVEEGRDVTLDGTGSVAATGFTWQETTATGVVLDDATSPPRPSPPRPQARC